MINYPVNINGTVWTFVNNQTMELTRRVHKPWPNLTGEKPARQKDEISPLLDVIPPKPVVDPATHFVVTDGWEIDLVNDEYRQKWLVQEITPEDLASHDRRRQLRRLVKKLRNSEGTNEQRLRRCERGLEMLLMDLVGEE